MIRFNSGGGKAGSGNWVWYYTWFGKVGGKSHSGVPDLFVFGKNVQFWIEVKRKSGAKREKQKEFIETVKKHGGQGAFIDSLDEAIAYEMQVQRFRGQSPVHNSADGNERMDQRSKEGESNSSRSRVKRKSSDKPE